jgi:aspartate kinase
LGPIAEANIDVDMIVQNVSHAGTTDFTFTIAKGDLTRALLVLEKDVVPVVKAKEVATSTEIAKVSCVGIGMRTHANVAARIFSALAKEGINIQMIGTSEIKVSLVIEDKYMELAVRALHQAFGLNKE